MKYELFCERELIEIGKLKAAGGKKPPYVSWGDWMLGSGWNAKYSSMTIMSTEPRRSQRDIARVFGLTPTWVSIILSSSRARLILADCHSQREQMLREGLRAKYRRLMNPTRARSSIRDT